MPVIEVLDQNAARITNPILSWSISATEVVSVNNQA